MALIKAKLYKDVLIFTALNIFTVGGPRSPCLTWLLAPPSIRSDIFCRTCLQSNMDLHTSFCKQAIVEKSKNKHSLFPWTIKVVFDFSGWDIAWPLSHFRFISFVKVENLGQNRITLQWLVISTVPPDHQNMGSFSFNFHLVMFCSPKLLGPENAKKKRVGKGGYVYIVIFLKALFILWLFTQAEHVEQHGHSE